MGLNQTPAQIAQSTQSGQSGALSPMPMQGLQGWNLLDGMANTSLTSGALSGISPVAPNNSALFNLLNNYMSAGKMRPGLNNGRFKVGAKINKFNINRF